MHFTIYIIIGGQAHHSSAQTLEAVNIFMCSSCAFHEVTKILDEAYKDRGMMLGGDM